MEARRPPHADVAQALLALLRHDGMDGQAVTVADDAPTTAWDIAALTGQAPPRDLPQPDPWELIVDTTRLRRTLGVRPRHPTVHTALDADAL